MNSSIVEIPNIIRGEELRKICTPNKEEFEMFKHESDNFRIFISDYNERNIQPASYDISVGDTCKNLTTGKVINVKEKGSLVINPNECAVIEAKEVVGIPYNCTALVTTKISLSMTGIFQVTSRIDPGFKGKLEITLLNAGKKSISLRYGDSFANLVFLKIGKPVSRGYEGDPRPKATLEYKPILKEEVERDKEGFVNSLLRSGHPFDIIAHLLGIQERTFDDRLNNLTNTLRRENIIFKFIAGLLAILLASALAGIFK